MTQATVAMGQARPAELKPARVLVESGAKRKVYHALPAGKVVLTARSVDAELDTATAQWVKRLDNIGEAFCDKTYAMSITDADLGVGSGAKGTWKSWQQTDPAQKSRTSVNKTPAKVQGDQEKEWQTIVD